ncbi:MAG: hypothetical protein PVG67_02615 [Desulfobacterales bacterium]|jgi:hypothetical protein
MNPLRSPTYVFFQSNPPLFDDAEMLQTDVMRFFAILSLCLLAIFALVNTLPMAPPDTRPAIVEPADQQAEVKRLQNNLGQILEDIADKRRVRSELTSQIKHENQNLTKIREKMALIQEKMDRNSQLNPESLQEPTEITPPPEPDQKGFTLRFASDEALETLIKAGKVNFYAIVGKNAWQIKLSNGNPTYIAAKFPRQIYEMETHTVPIDYKVVFQRQIAVFGRHTLTWGVTLPGSTTDSINQMVTTRKGGNLIITADGEVKLI